MDIINLRVAVTVVSLVLFVALVALTYSRSRRAAHDEAARLPFVGDDDRHLGGGGRP